MANPNVPSFELTLPDGTKTWVSAQDIGYTYVPAPVITPPIEPAPTFTFQAVATESTITLTWPPEITNAWFGRDGQDASGHGEWTSEPGQVSPQVLTGLKSDTSYVVLVSGRFQGAEITSSQLVKTKAAPVVVPEPTPTPTPTPQPSAGGFKAMTFGAAVTDAANGNFNKWAGKRHGLYATWGDNGKIWAIDSATAEYGANSVTRLGDYDLDVAPQRKLATNWAGAAKGDTDGTWRSDITELKAKWGNRKGTLYYRPFHEFNGDWYQWSVRSAADQANMVTAWRRLHGIWKSIVGTDVRFKLEWSPNRDSKYSLDVRNSWPGSQYVDVLGPDYYDFSKANTEALWAQELNRTQNGGSPVGIQAWFDFGRQQGVPVMFPEYGQQFGDNPLFIQKTTALMEANRYTGTGSAAGKFLGYAWHNLQGSSPDPSAGGDFFVTRGGADYAGRKNASAAMRNWLQKSTWLRVA